MAEADVLRIVCVTVALSAGCTRGGFSVARDGPSTVPSLDRRSGEPSPADLPARRCSWQGSFTVETPAPMPELNTTDDELEPFLTSDGLTLYFASDRAGGQGDIDVYFATRPDRGSPFGDVRSYTSVNTAQADTRFALFPDGLTAVLATARPGGKGSQDLWIGSRASLLVPFESKGFVPLSVLNTVSADYDPAPSADGQRLYFSSESWISATSSADLLVAERIGSGPYSAPILVPGVNATDAAEGNPVLSADECVIVFNSTRPGGVGSSDLWYATRPDRSSPFSSPRLVPNVNTASYEAEACLAPDGCTLYFSREVDTAGQYHLDLYAARIVGG